MRRAIKELLQDRSLFNLTPQLHYFGLTQKRAPLALREKVPTDRDSQLVLLEAMSEFASGRFVLATCERFEIYASGTPRGADEWIQFLADWFRLPRTELSLHMEFFTGCGVAEHLLRVAAGLESRIVGEQQILGQVRNAYRNAMQQRSLDAQLSLMTRTAIRVGKRARQETLLNRGGRSIATLAMDWLRQNRKSLTDKTVSIIGSGRLAGLVASRVICQKPGKFIFAGRNQTRAILLAEQFDATFREFSRLQSIVDESDVVFACTASPNYLIDASHIAGRTKPLQVVDLCVPRNVDPAAANAPEIELAHLDDLISDETALGSAANEESKIAIQQAEELVAAELDAFRKWRRERQAIPFISELLARMESANCVEARRALHHQIIQLKAGVTG